MKKIELRPLGIAAMLLLAAVLSSCGGAEIDQTVEETSCLKKTSRIITNVVIKDWMGGYKTIEYQTWLVVPNDKVDSIKKAEYDKALPFLEAARNCR